MSSCDYEFGACVRLKILKDKRFSGTVVCTLAVEATWSPIFVIEWRQAPSFSLDPNSISNKIARMTNSIKDNHLQ